MKSNFAKLLKIGTVSITEIVDELNTGNRDKGITNWFHIHIDLEAQNSKCHYHLCIWVLCAFKYVYNGTGMYVFVYVYVHLIPRMALV